MRYIYYLLFIFAIAIPFSCEDMEVDCVEGKGELVSRDLNIDPIRKIELKGLADIRIARGSQQKVVIRGQENILNELNREVKRGNWIIGFDPCVKNYDRLEIEITLPSLQSITVSGAGNIRTLDPIVSDSFFIRTTGSFDIQLDLDVKYLDSHLAGMGDIVFSGTAAESSHTLSGTGNIEALQLQTQNSKAKIKGVGNLHLQVNRSLAATISGTGNILYREPPQEIYRNISGSGTIARIE